MALYKGTVKLDGIETGFLPENVGSTGQVLKKTATGYAWANESGGGGGTYTAGNGINISINNEISVDTTVVATQADLTSKANVSDLNTKTFYLSGTSDLVNAQAAYDWYVAGKNPIIVYDNRTYPLDRELTGEVFFTSPLVSSLEVNWYSEAYTQQPFIKFTISSGIVTGISASNWNNVHYLSTQANPNIPFTPTVDGHPTTKKYVDDRDTYIGTSAPTNNLVEGRLWYDTTNDQLKVYDGTNWNETGKEYNAGVGIGISNTTNGRQGPSPVGFHIPAQSDWTGVETIMNSLNLTSITQYSTSLLLPCMGRRGIDGVLSGVGTEFSYYTSSSACTSYSDTWGAACMADGMLSDSCVERATGLPIRSFKDEYVAPDSNWAVIYGTLGSAGIFWNQSKGLISITDGTNGYTMMDKNLGATVVYHYGDTLTDANMGYYYQWGNNYGFPATGTLPNISTTKVDTSSYGPGNYYSSSTYIDTSGYEFPDTDWSVVQNNNLWGDITPVVVVPGGGIISNTGVLSVNGQTGDVILDGSPEKIFSMPEVGDNITDILNWIDAGGTALIEDSIWNEGPCYTIDNYYRVNQRVKFLGVSTDGYLYIGREPGHSLTGYNEDGIIPTIRIGFYNGIVDSVDAIDYDVKGMVILSYGHNSWQDFMDAYNRDAIVYCKASSQSNPGTGNQTRMAFMAFVDKNATTGVIQGVEFQYYRSRSDHNSAANQLDEVYVYKLVPADGGTWTVTQRNTGAKAVAGTGISLTFGSGNMTISNTGVTSVNGQTGTVVTQDVYTRSGYDALPSSKNSDNAFYFIKE